MVDAASPPNQAPSRFVGQVRRAVAWRSGSQIVAQAIQWSATFLVIRILQPADYGLFAMTQVVLALLSLLNGYGLASGIVARADVSRREVGQLFGMLLVVNAALALAQWFLAPAVAAYYRQPQIADLLRVQSVLYLLAPFIALPQALLARGLDFSRQAKANVAASLASAATAAGGALAGWGVWTLVAAPIVLFSVRGAMLTMAAGGLPRPVFRFGGTGGLVRFGGTVAAGQFLGFLWTQADVLIGGRHLSAHQLGVYSTSLFLAQIFVSKIAPPIHDVAFAAYAKLGADRAAVGRAFLQFARVATMVAMPFHLGLAATAEPLVLVVLGPQWVEAAPVVRALSLAMPFYAVHVLLAPVADGIGRPALNARNGLVAALLAPAALLVAVRWGPVGLAAAWGLVFPALLWAGAGRVLPEIGVSASRLLGVVAPPALAALAMAAVVVLVDRWVGGGVAPAPKLLLLVGVGGAVYGGWLVLFARDSLRELWSLARRS